MRLTPLELDRVAAGTGAPEPQHARQPIRPHDVRMIHCEPSICETTARMAAQLPFPEPGFRMRCDWSAASIPYALGVTTKMGFPSPGEERFSASLVESFAVGSAPAGSSPAKPVASGRVPGWHKCIFVLKRGDKWFFTSLCLMLLIRAPVVRLRS